MQAKAFLNGITPKTAEQRQKQPRTTRSTLRRFAPLITLIVTLVVWQLVTMFELVSAFIIPAPVVVLERFYTVAMQSSRINFWLHVGTTLQEILLGLGLGLSVGFVLGYWVAKQPWLEDLLSPLVVAFQATPIVAYAPLLVIWFGTGMTSKIFVVVLIVFFPHVDEPHLSVFVMSPAICTT